MFDVIVVGMKSERKDELSEHIEDNYTTNSMHQPSQYLPPPLLNVPMLPLSLLDDVLPIRGKKRRERERENVCCVAVENSNMATPPPEEQRKSYRSIQPRPPAVTPISTMSPPLKKSLPVIVPNGKL